MKTAATKRTTKTRTAADKATGGTPPARRPRRRMRAEDREEIILREATIYFAENGLSAGTIELARRIGITQPLLYKYFPTKDALFEKVYERLIPQSWNPDWLRLLDDESISLRERLRAFYADYATTVLTYEHVRLFLFSGLSHNDFNNRYYTVLTKRIFERIAMAIRHEFGDATNTRPVTRAELEQVQSLHAVIYHLAYRRWVHGESLGDDMAEMVSRKVDLFLDGAREILKRANRSKSRRSVGAGKPVERLAYAKDV
jgi:AcrR family transcriptional regulator